MPNPSQSSNRMRAQAEASLRHSLHLLDDLGLAVEAALVSQALETMMANVSPAIRAEGE